MKSILMLLALVVAIVSMVTTPMIVLATSIGVGNITDGKPRISLIQEEDFSLSLYQTINGTTIQIAGFDNILEAADYFNNNLELEPEDIEELQEPETREEEEDDDNNEEPEPEPEPEPVEDPVEGPPTSSE